MRLRNILFVAAITFTPAASHAQGCSQCRDNLAATPPRTQSAYRNAIYLMMGTGATIFLASALLFNRFRRP